MSDQTNLPHDGIPVVHEVVAERGKTYGSFAVNAGVSQSLKNAMRAAPGWKNLSDAQREGLEMIAAKAARMLTGDPSHLDNAVDMGGYAQCIVQAMVEADQGVRPMRLGRSVVDTE